MIIESVKKLLFLQVMVRFTTSYIESECSSSSPTYFKKIRTKSVFWKKIHTKSVFQKKFLKKKFVQIHILQKKKKYTYTNFLTKLRSG